MSKYTCFFISFLLFACESDPSKLSRSGKTTITGDDTELPDSLSLDTDEDNGLEPLKQCIRHASFKAPLIACLDDFEPEMEEASPLLVDSIFLLTVGKMYDMAEEVYFDDERDLVKDTWELKPELIRKYKAHGFVTDQEEGMYFIAPDYQFLSDRFGEIVSPDMVKYLNFRTKNPYKITYDAGLSIEWMEFAERLIKEEKLLSKESPVVNEIVSSELISESLWFMSGMDNSPIYDWESSEILPDYRNALYSLKQDGGPYLRKLAEKQINYLQSVNWKVDPNKTRLITTSDQAQKLFRTQYPDLY